MPRMKIRLILPIVFAIAFPQLVMPVHAQIVPGTGQQIVEVFDDFEDPNWSFTLNLPKSSANIDKVERHPSGFSANRMYLESLYRGTPDFVRRVETPPGGIRGSKGALAMQTLISGIPGQHSYTFQQDDLIAGVQQRLGYMLPVSWTPSYVCRVYVPPFEKWERRHGSHFGFRADCMTTIDKPNIKGRYFKNFGKHRESEQYWPGFFIQLNMKQVTGEASDTAMLVIRGDEKGHEVPGPKITKPGWWTLGMSFTPNGQVHFYAHEGVEDLTARDHIYSSYPYGYKCEQTSTFFFNIVNQDDGHTWSTRWIVDDPKVFVATGSYRPSLTPQVAQAQPVAEQTQPAVQQGPVPPDQVPATAAKTPATIPLMPPVTAQATPATQPAPKPVTQSEAPAVVAPKAATAQTVPAPVQSPVMAPTPAATSQNPPVKTVQTPVSQPSPVATKPAAPASPQTASKPPAAPSLKAPPPLDPSIPQLASKPTELVTPAPKKEVAPDEPTPAPVAASTTPTEVKPVPVSPVIEDPAPAETPSSTPKETGTNPPATPEAPAKPD